MRYLRVIVILLCTVFFCFAEEENRDNEKIPFDLFIMSGCPYGIEAIDQLLALQKKSDVLDWNIWFIGCVEEDSLVPALQDGSINDEMIYLAVKELYKEYYDDFLWLLIQDSYTPDRAVSDLELDSDSISQWIEDNGFNILKNHYATSESIGVHQSPSLLIEGIPYEESVFAERILFDICEADLDSGEHCLELGECISDSDCEPIDGVSSECNRETNQCKKFREDSFIIIQVLPEDTLYTEQNRFTETTANLFPSADIRTVRQGDEHGDILIEKYSPEAIPFYVFDSTISKMRKFDEVAEGLENRDDIYLFRNGYMTGTYFYQRKLIADNVKIFVDFESVAYDEIREQYPNIYPYPVVTQDQIDSYSDDQLVQLKNAYESSDSVNIADEQSEIVYLAGKEPQEYYDIYLKDITVHSPIYLLFDNRDIEIIKSMEQFEEAVQWITD